MVPPERKQREAARITSGVFLYKMNSLNGIMRKHQSNLNHRTVYKNTCNFKSIKVMGSQRKIEEMLKRTKEHDN